MKSRADGGQAIGRSGLCHHELWGLSRDRPEVSPDALEALTYDTQQEGLCDRCRSGKRLMGAPSYTAGEEPFSEPEYGQQVQDYWSSVPT